MAKVLIIEDDLALRHDMLCQASEWGHEVLAAGSGRAGFRAIKDWAPDVVLSDVNMPDGSGLDLMRSIRRSGLDSSGMVYFVISSERTSKTAVEALTLGADDYLVKPVSYPILRAKIDSHLRKQSAHTSEIDELSQANAAINGASFAAVFASGLAVFGLVSILFLYSLKSALGINLFEGVHLGDLFGGS